MSLKNKSISGFKWTTFSAAMVSILQLLQLSILARFLDPSAFGLMALVTVVVGFSQTFLDAGISNAIIYKQEISRDQLSTLYWINIFGGLILFLVVILTAPYISEFFKEPELRNILNIIAPIFIIQSIGQQFAVLWRKEMRFSEISKIDVLNKITSLIVSVYFAAIGFGVYALVYGVIAGVTMQTMLYVYLGLKEYRPSFIFKIVEVKEFISFGLFQMGERSIRYFTSQADSIIIGKLIGVDALGIYTILKQIIEKTVYMINGILNQVTFPMLSKIQQNELKLKTVYMRVLNIITFIQYPFLTALYFYGYEVILIMLGDKWIGTDSLVKLFAIYSLFLVYNNPIGSLILARGRANWSFYANVIYSILYPTSIYFFTSHYGLNGALYGFIFISILSIFPYWKLLISKLILVGFFEYNAYFLFQILISFFSGFLGYILGNYLFDNLLFKLVTYVFTTMPVFFALNYAFNKMIFYELKSLRKK